MPGCSALPITARSATSALWADRSAAALYVGGLVGFSYLATITDAYATSAVSGSRYVGGLVGSASGGTVTDAYATGAASADSGISYVGGLIGSAEAMARSPVPMPRARSAATAAMSAGWSEGAAASR